jgi:hypothetical protein
LLSDDDDVDVDDLENDEDPSLTTFLSKLIQEGRGLRRSWLTDIPSKEVSSRDDSALLFLHKKQRN